LIELRDYTKPLKTAVASTARALGTLGGLRDLPGDVESALEARS